MVEFGSKGKVGKVGREMVNWMFKVSTKSKVCKGGRKAVIDWLVELVSKSQMCDVRKLAHLEKGKCY